MRGERRALRRALNLLRFWTCSFKGRPQRAANNGLEMCRKPKRQGNNRHSRELLPPVGNTELPAKYRLFVP